MATRIAANPRALIATAASQLGVSEEPPRSNCQRFGAWYPMNCVAWCAIFVSWVFAHAGYRQAIRTLNGASYVPDWVAYAKATGQWRPVGTYTPKAGDVVIFWFTNRPDHIGLVVRPIDGGVETIEGNTSSGGSRTGGSVLRLNRRSRIHGYIAVDYVDIIPEPPADGGGSSVPVGTTPSTSQAAQEADMFLALEGEGFCAQVGNVTIPLNLPDLAAFARLRDASPGTPTMVIPAASVPDAKEKLLYQTANATKH